jgi:hypothetical protein
MAMSGRIRGVLTPTRLGMMDSDINGSVLAVEPITVPRQSSCRRKKDIPPHNAGYSELTKCKNFGRRYSDTCSMRTLTGID